MAAGDLITADYQAELRATLVGTTTNYDLVDVEITKQRRTTDVPKLLADGKFGGKHWIESILITLTLNAKGTSDSNLTTNLATLETAWARSQSDIDFVLRLPGWGTKGKKISGRPVEYEEGVFAPTRVVNFHQLGVRCQFEGLTPTWTTVT